jgi:hypothetical protein
MSKESEEPNHDPTPEVEIGMEEPPDDVLEQHRIEGDDADEADLEGPGAQQSPLEADPADVAEQRRGVLADDEWRDD